MSSGMNVTVRAASDLKESTANASGQEVHLITDNERNAFGLSDKGLKQAVYSYFGKGPNDAYLRSPTHGDLYKKYGWEQVQTTLRPINTEVLNLDTKPTIVQYQNFSNHSSEPADFNVSITKEVTNSVSNTWSSSNTVGVSNEIEYSVSFEGVGAKGKTTMSFSSTVGESKTVSESVLLGSAAGVTVRLNPGEEVEAVLQAFKGTMTVKITYEATLSGVTAVNYNPTYKGHHFFALPINSVMASANLPRSIRFDETVDIEYYSDSMVELRNPKDPSDVRMRFAGLVVAGPDSRLGAKVPQQNHGYQENGDQECH